MDNVKFPLALTVLLACQCQSFAQCNEIKSDRIRSLQVVAGTKWMSMPIIKLNENENINISFDDLTHVNHRYVYRLQHCEANWTISDDIFESDYCEGFPDGNTIDDSEESINTNTIYTHYRLSLPNDKCKFKISGNYRLSVYDENEGDTILNVYFMVIDPLMSVNLYVSPNTDIDTNKSHQQISMSLRYNNINVTNPEREIHTVVLQNGRWETARRDVHPQYMPNDGLRWEHNKSYIFDAGNEYRKFEILSTDHPTLGIEEIKWTGEDYKADIWTDFPRLSYVYDEDANGAFYIRNSDNYENDVTSDYINVRFRVKSQLENGKVYVNGCWTNGLFDQEYEMTYNNNESQYEKTIKLKQGYYSYQYLLKRDNQIIPLPSEGNFFQTENKYQALIYWKGIGQRTDLLVGYGEVQCK